MGLTEFAPTLPHPIGNYDYTILLENLQNMWDDYVFSYAYDFRVGSTDGNPTKTCCFRIPAL